MPPIPCRYSFLLPARHTLVEAAEDLPRWQEKSHLVSDGMGRAPSRQGAATHTLSSICCRAGSDISARHVFLASGRRWKAAPESFVGVTPGVVPVNDTQRS